jgi:hypothetical protein
VRPLVVRSIVVEPDPGVNAPKPGRNIDDDEYGHDGQDRHVYYNPS